MLTDPFAAITRIRMLLVARGGRRGAACTRRWGYVEGQHLNLPSVAFTNINRRPKALKFYRNTAFALKNRTPRPCPPDLISSRSYHVRGTLIVLVEMVAVMPLLEHPCKILFDGPPTEKRPLRSHLDRVLREKRGHRKNDLSLPDFSTVAGNRRVSGSEGRPLGKGPLRRLD
jgi:hypothetical protein